MKLLALATGLPLAIAFSCKPPPPETPGADPGEHLLVTHVQQLVFQRSRSQIRYEDFHFSLLP